MLFISNDIVLASREIEISAIKAQGPGGQNVNKVATAIHLRFDIPTSSLPEIVKERLLMLNDQRLTKEGVIIIKAQQGRSQDKSKAEALKRLQELIQSVLILPKARRPTKPTRNSQKKRLDGKNTRGQVKALRGKVTD